MFISCLVWILLALYDVNLVVYFAKQYGYDNGEYLFILFEFGSGKHFTRLVLISMIFFNSNNIDNNDSEKVMMIQTWFDSLWCSIARQSFWRRHVVYSLGRRFYFGAGEGLHAIPR
jgi:hypothetical protein